MAPYLNNNMVSDLMNTYTDALKKELCENLKAVVLFGSYARGDNEFDSDIDVFILLSEMNSDVIKQVRYLASGIGLQHDAILSTFIKDLVAFEKYKSIEPIYKNILKDGEFYYDNI